MDAWRQGYESQYSAFNQPSVESVESIPAEIDNALKEIGVIDAAQLLALEPIPGVREELAKHLGVNEKRLSAIFDDARGAVPRYLAAAVATPRPADHAFGALPPPPEEMQAAAEIPFVGMARAAAALPATTNLASGMSPIREQANRGTCVSFATTALHEYALRARGQNRNLSEQYLYFRIKQLDGSPNICGTWQSAARDALKRFGECRETVWPYNPNLPCNQGGPVPNKADQDAAKYKLQLQQLNPKDVAGIKAVLASGRPVAISIPVWQSWYASADTFATGRITMRIGNESGPNGQPAGHAVCLIGYQDNAQYPGGGYFILRNSWGVDWASQSPYGAGNGTIPYQYIANENWEAFTIPSIAGLEPTNQEDAALSEEADDLFSPEKPRTITIETGGITITIA
jgi:C1A family cysteine protease